MQLHQEVDGGFEDDEVVPHDGWLESSVPCFDVPHDGWLESSVICFDVPHFSALFESEDRDEALFCQGKLLPVFDDAEDVAPVPQESWPLDRDAGSQAFWLELAPHALSDEPEDLPPPQDEPLRQPSPWPWS